MIIDALGHHPACDMQILYDLKTTDPDTIKAVNQLFRQRLSECHQVLYPGSSYGGAALTTTPTAYGYEGVAANILLQTSQSEL